MRASEFLGTSSAFENRHIGPTSLDRDEMLQFIGATSLDQLVNETIPKDIRLERPLALGPARNEHETLAQLRTIASKNQVVRSLIGMGYSGCITPSVIKRNILENPGWYTQYTPYQAEIAQGRMEALVNFQTMVADLCGLPLANASLLDEATAAAEAMSMCMAITKSKKKGFFVADNCHPQTIAVLKTRAEPLGIQLIVGATESIDFKNTELGGILLQYPGTDGAVYDLNSPIAQAHAAGVVVVVATDLLALTLLRPPGEMGADIVVGSSQRFGVPMGAGGPHAAFLATSEAHKRLIPGRIIGVSKDSHQRPAYRLALQTREQHIRRDKATSNICTAQVLLAVISGAYAVYHGAEGLTQIARRTHALASIFAFGMKRLGFDLGSAPFFDTVRIRAPHIDLFEIAAKAGFNLRKFPNSDVGLSFDELSTSSEVNKLLALFANSSSASSESLTVENLAPEAPVGFDSSIERTSSFLQHEVFKKYRSEHEMLRYLNRMQARDLSLTHSMIPLGSCTMKLNATSEMEPITWREFSDIHPFAPKDQQDGYHTLFRQLETWLAEITGFAAVSLQPNAGSQGEYTGLLVIRAYHQAQNEHHRNICLIPTSAHGTNPASAVMAGMKVVAVKCDAAGNIDLSDLKKKAETHKANLAAMMITYPSTHGVFETSIREACEIVKSRGGRVYLDGANMNAQVGLARPGDFGADVCHLNLHKTFCIPHGGGGPGMGPVGAVSDLAQYLPGHPFASVHHDAAIGPVAAAPYGSPNILPISWMYIAMMGAQGLKRASQIAILNANYMARRLSAGYEILYSGINSRVAHEFILDMRPFKKSAGIEVDDIAKRLMDFGFHAPTMSWPVAGTIMVEPTESESKAELDRYCDALLTIREEIRDIEEGRADQTDNPLKNAPHTAEMVAGAHWNHSYSRTQAIFPAPWIRAAKFWPPVGRVDNAYGDRHLMCTCPPMDDFVDT